MKIISFFMITFIFIFTCCTSTQPLIKLDIEPSPVINEKLEGRKVSITLLNGEELVGKDIKLERDSLSYKDLQSQWTKVIATQEIKKIYYKNHSIGALEGLGLGILAIPVGMFLGAIIVYSGSGGKDFSGYAGALIGGGITPLLGFTLGAAIGHTYKYEQFVILEVSSVARKGRFVVFIWNGKEIRLSKRRVKHMKRRGDNTYIIISKELYEKKF
jgi:hypothetical protein